MQSVMSTMQRAQPYMYIDFSPEAAPRWYQAAPYPQQLRDHYLGSHTLLRDIGSHRRLPDCQLSVPPFPPNPSSSLDRRKSSVLRPGFVGMRGQWSYYYGMQDYEYNPPNSLLGSDLAFRGLGGVLYCFKPAGPLALRLVFCLLF